jgi:AraC-like DNA-binding protein
MHRRPGDPWTTSVLAARAGVSRTVLFDRFQASLGVAPLTYLTQVRMSLATHSLTRGDEGIDAVAERCGYRTVAGFRRAFRTATGMTPGEFRRQRSA